MGPGLEIIGFQSIRGFPRVSDGFAARFRELVAEHGFEPSCLAINADVAIRSDRFLTDDEHAGYLAAQIRAAAKLGFPVVRSQATASPAVVERLLPLAEELEIAIGAEIHSASTVDSAWVLELRELYERLDSPFLGFIPDFGASTLGISPGVFDVYRAKGVSETLLQAVRDRWQELHTREFEPGEEIGRLIELAHRHGAGDHAVNLAVFAVGIHGHQDPRRWAEIADDVVHVHGKFFAIDGGRDPVVPFEVLLPVLADAGYTGFVSSEYEGWHWDTTSDPFEQVVRQQELCRRILAERAA
jgi:sugar phosphate isomerase/epimerase